MLWYKCNLRNVNGRTVTHRKFEAHDDWEALTFARKLHAIYAECVASHGGWELKQGKRLVFAEENKPEFAWRSEPADADYGGASRLCFS
jgi:hypothetical protein